MQSYNTLWYWINCFKVTYQTKNKDAKLYSRLALANVEKHNNSDSSRRETKLFRNLYASSTG